MKMKGFWYYVLVILVMVSGMASLAAFAKAGFSLFG